MAATDFVTETQIDSLVTNVATAVKANTTAINNHIGDTSDAHDASAISVADVATQLTATDVEAALAEIMDYAQTKTDDTTVNAHIADATAAHAASAISVADAGGHLTATDVEAALAEIWTIADGAAGGGVSINDAATNTTQTWSSQKSTDYIAAQIAAVINSAPAALDTLDELAAALGDDANFASTVTTALGNRLRFDAAQTLTSPQKAQGQANLGVVTSTVDFAANFNTAIA
jgi:hypothetical protein